VFPESEYSSPSALQNRWRSVVHSDFVPVPDQVAAADRRAEERREKEERMDRAAEKAEVVKSRRDLEKDKKTLLPRVREIMNISSILLRKRERETWRRIRRHCCLG
jgi:hypothetical protein